jgi:tetratricopeptide (TPR) repeat protein
MERMMGKDYLQGTATLARVFAEQGHWEKSVEIYRNLLRQDPDRPDLAQALAAAEAALRAAQPQPAQTLAPLFQEWIDLLLRCDRIRKLRRFKTRISNSTPKTDAP